MKDKLRHLIEILQNVLARLNTWLDKLRQRIPGLPPNNTLLGAGVLVVAAAMLFVVFQVFLAPRQKFTTYELPYEQNFDDVNLRRWFSGEGVWAIRNGALNQTIGGETITQAHIPLKLLQDVSYHASVYITLKKDTQSAGLAFNSQYPDLEQKQHRVYITRPDKDTLALVAGYMDKTGSFVTQSQVPLSVNTTEFRLDVYVYKNTYLVQLNGQRLVETRPLFYKNGLLGFFAIGPAIFDTFKLTVANDANPGDLVYNSDFDKPSGGGGWAPFGGKWVLKDQMMVQTDPVAVNAGIGYETSTFQNFTLRATFNHLSGQGAGILFNMPSPYEYVGAHIVRYSDETDAMIWGYFDEQGLFVRQGYVETTPSGRDTHTIQVFSGDTSYDVFLDDQILVRGVQLVSKQGCVGLVTSASTVGYSLVEVYPLFGSPNRSTLQVTAAAQTATPETTTSPTPAPKKTTTPKTVTPKPAPSATAGVVVGLATPVSIQGAVQGGQSPYYGAFTGALSDQGWVPLNGEWSFQDGNFMQLKRDGYDFSVIHTGTIFRNYSFQVKLTHLEGSGGGLLFNLPYIDRLAGGYMVRYSDRRDNALIWGYFDATGVYKNQGYADVNPASTDQHVLRVVSGDGSYSIYLDNLLIVQAIPFVNGQNFGYIGLIASVASVSYSEVSVDGVGAAFRGTYSNFSSFTDPRVVSGNWTQTGNSLAQSVPDFADYVWNTGVQASQFTISARITLPIGSSALGGGFIFNMAERGTKNNAYIVRLIEGGQGIWWGSTDAAGKFKGQGSVTLTADSPTFLVKVVVVDSRMTVFVNGQEMATNVLLSKAQGWIGLVAYGGPVTFEELTLVVEK